MHDISLDNWDGDAEALEKMAHTAWRDEYEIDSYPNLYRPDYLAYLMRNLDDPRLAMAAYQDGEIVGFLLNLPRTMALDGREYRAALSCLLVVRKQAFRQGVAKALVEEGLRRNRELKLDFTLFYLETGHRSSKLFAMLQSRGRPIFQVKRMHVIGRVLDLDRIRASENVKGWEVAVMKLLRAHRPPSDGPDPAVREASPDDADQILALLNAHQGRVRLARVYEREEMVRELFSPPLARTLVYEQNGRIAGVLAFVVIDHVGRRAVPWAWINHLAWNDLWFGERRSFIRTFLRIAGEAGCAGVVEWSKNVYPTAALYAARFVPYPRSVNMMAWSFTSGLSLSHIPDVYEVQI